MRSRYVSPLFGHDLVIARAIRDIQLESFATGLLQRHMVGSVVARARPRSPPRQHGKQTEGQHKQQDQLVAIFGTCQVKQKVTRVNSGG